MNNNTDPTQAVEILQQNNTTLVQMLHTREVTDKDTQKGMQDNVILIRGNIDRVMSVKKGLEEPHQEGLRRIKTLFDPLVNSMREAERIGVKKLSDWRIAEQERNEKALNTYIIDYQAQVKEAQQTGEVIQPPPLPDIYPSKTEHSNAGALNYSDDWEILVPFPEKVSREYCEPSMRKLRAAVKSGKRYIEGCIIKPKFTIKRTGGNRK